MPSKTNNRHFKKNILLVPCIIVLLIIIALSVFLLFFNDYRKQTKADLEQLASLEYNGIFCSMYSIENFAQEDFSTYRGINTLKFDNVLRSTSDLEEYLSAAFASGNTIQNIYLGLDPAQMWYTSLKNTDRLNRFINEDIVSYATAHPEVTFEILLPVPSLEYWQAKSLDKTDELLSAYQSLISTLNQCSNIMVYFMGNEHWLIANPANYSDTLTTNDMISQKIMLFTFCDHEYQITAENAPAQLSTLREIILEEQTSPTQYPDLSSWDVVFFGDSIIGNYSGSFSVPGVVSGLSNAKTYNCAKGGMPACDSPEIILSFPKAVDFFVAQDASQIPGGDPFQTSIEDYVQEEHSGRNLCFVINFGLNDYFMGNPITNAENSHDTATYSGALRVGISKLQNTYPDAAILLMTPTFTVEFSNGTEKMSEKGGVLTQYVDAALQVADEMNVICLNNYTDLGINESTAWTYLADGTHLNETGRFLLAEHIINHIGD